jgi:carbamoyltransferase
MLILSIAALSAQGAVALVEDGRILAAATQSKPRGHLEFPSTAVATVLRRAGRRATEVEAVAWPFFGWRTEVRQLLRGLATELPASARLPGSAAEKARHAARHAEAVGRLAQTLRDGDHGLARGLAALGIEARLHRVEYHLALHAAAYFGSGHRRALLLSLDHVGSGLAGAVAIGTEGGIERLHPFPYPHSFGAWNDLVAKVLGVASAVPEPALAGLAAGHDPNVLRDRIRARIVVDAGDFQLGAALDPTFFADLAARYTRGEVAAAWQRVQEDVAAEVVGHYLHRHALDALAVAGRVFSNPRLNQRLAALPGLRALFAHPAVGIEAAALGAGLWLSARAGVTQRRRVDHPPLTDLALGPAFGDAVLTAALERAGVRYSRPVDVTVELAATLARGGVVARFCGPLEYGDRALGQRSVFFGADDRARAEWVAGRLGRPPALPYACLVSEAAARQAFSGPEAARPAARFGACTLTATEAFEAAHPMLVSPDGAACPRIVEAGSEPELTALLEEYTRRTGLVALAHTGLRRPGHALVEGPDEAIQAFSAAGFDRLAFGPFLVERAGA